jgi:protein ImuA
MHLGAATGFASALAARAGSRREVLWVATDFAQAEAGSPYGPGLDGLGLAATRLVLLRVPRALDVLWAMEEALRCRALGGVLAELTEAAVPDLTATRRLALAARDGAGFGFLLRQCPSGAPTAAATRWRIAGSASEPDAYGGLGPAAFDLALIKNRRGPTGRWTITWDNHECVFRPAVSLGVAEAAVDRSDRAPFARAG